MNSGILMGGTRQNSLSCLLLLINFCSHQNYFAFQVLVKSGVEQSLFDTDLPEQIGVTIKPLTSPISALALNAKFLAKITV